MNIGSLCGYIIDFGRELFFILRFIYFIAYTTCTVTANCEKENIDFVVAQTNYGQVVLLVFFFLIIWLPENVLWFEFSAFYT